MIPLALEEVAAAVGGRLVDADPRAVVTGGVEFDSRKVGPGGLFVAFPGEKVDGHDFAAAAVAAGAASVPAGLAVSTVDPGVPAAVRDELVAELPDGTLGEELLGPAHEDDRRGADRVPGDLVDGDARLLRRLAGGSRGHGPPRSRTPRASGSCRAPAAQ